MIMAHKTMTNNRDKCGIVKEAKGSKIKGIDKFSYNNDRAAESEAKYSLFTSLPRLILEWLIVFGMFVS